MDVQRISCATPWLCGSARPDGIVRLRQLLTAYALLDCEVGYCQGLTELAAPFLELYERDDEAFAGFCGLMARVRRNFLSGMHDMHRQLQQLGKALDRVDRSLHRHIVKIGAGSYVFAFQMLLLQLRREVSWPDVFTLWECMWASEALLASSHQRQQQPLELAAAARGTLMCSSAGALSPQLAQQPQREFGVGPGVGGPRGSVSYGGEGPAAGVQGAVTLARRALSYTVPEGSATQDRLGESAESAGSTGSAASPVVACAQAPVPWAAEASCGAAGDAAAARPDLRVFVVAAALRAQRRRLLACRSLEEVIQFTNRFPPPRDVIGLVHEAERIYRACHRDGSARQGRPAKTKPLRFLYACLRPGPQLWAATEHAAALS